MIGYSYLRTQHSLYYKHALWLTDRQASPTFLSVSQTNAELVAWTYVALVLSSEPASQVSCKGWLYQTAPKAECWLKLLAKSTKGSSEASSAFSSRFLSSKIFYGLSQTQIAHLRFGCLLFLDFKCPRSLEVYLT